MRAIVLGGGGTKGSYEIGAWRALKELGITYDIVTGTSIGAINGALMVQNKFEEAERLWNTIELEDIIKWNNKDKKFILEKGTMASMALNYIKYRGLDITPLKNLINEKINPDKILSSPYIFGITTVELPFKNPIEQNIKETIKDDIRSFILASASCYPIFPACKINEHYYIDGGYYDNLPIDFAFDLGATSIIAIDLNYKITHPRYLHHKNIHYIKPSRDLGPFLFFQKETIQNNMKLGYLDTMKSFNKYIGIKYAFLIPNKNSLEENKQKFMKTIAWFEEKYKVSLVINELKDNSELIFIKGLENTMEFFLENPFEVYDIKLLIEKYHFETKETSDEERNVFDNISSVEGCYQLLKQKGKWQLLKLLNYFLFEKKLKIPFITEILLNFKKEILIILFIKSL